MLTAKYTILIFFMVVLFIQSCNTEEGIIVPEKIVDKDMTKLISDDEALKVIDKLHGLSVAPEKNAIAEYGNDPKDLLYISWYGEEENAKEAFKLMIDKMQESETGPFTHIRALPDYDGKVYMSIGMGAIHYIYLSKNHVLWLQTYQEIGRELPENLLKLYPIF